MTVRTVGDAVIYLGAIAAALAALGVVVRFAVVRPMTRWITEQAHTARQVRAAPAADSAVEAQVDRIEAQLTELRTDLKDHIADHSAPLPRPRTP